MIRTNVRALALGLAVTGLPCVAHAQAPAASKRDEKSAKDEALEAARRRTRRSLELVDGLSDDAKTLPSTWSRVRVLRSLADFVWPYDAARAERLARVAYDTADNDMAPDDPDREPAIRFEREQVIDTIRKHDAALARKYAERLARDVPAPDPNGDADRPEDVRRLLAAAYELAPDDPGAAAAFVRRVIATGDVPPNLSNVLDLISERSPELGASLVEAALAVCRERGMSPQYLRTTAIPLDADENGLLRVISERVDPSVARAYVETEIAYLANAADADEAPTGEAARSFYDEAATLVSYADQLDPTRSADARALATRLRARISPDYAAAVDARLAGDLGGLFDRGGAWAADDSDIVGDEAMIRDGTLGGLAVSAADAGDSAKARDLASKIRDDETRQDAFDSIAVYDMTRAEHDGRYDDVGRLASQISDPVWRAKALSDLADTDATRGRRERALALYGDMYRVLTAGGTMAPSRGAPLLMSYARTLVPSDPLRALSTLSEAAGAANREQDVGLRRELVGRTRDNVYVETYAVFALVDFDRAIDAARSLDDPYARLYALAGVATGALRHDAAILAAAKRPRRGGGR